MAKKILVVEDNTAIRELLRFLLQKEGYEVETAIDGSGVVERVREQPVAMILMDVMMRGEDGFQICRRLKAGEDTRHIPVMLLSARGQKTEREEGLRAGASAYLVKPFEPEVLMASVRDLVNAGGLRAA